MTQDQLLKIANRLKIVVGEVSSHIGPAYNWYDPSSGTGGDVKFRSPNLAKNDMLKTLERRIKSSYELLKIVHEVCNETSN